MFILLSIIRLYIFILLLNFNYCILFYSLYYINNILQRNLFRFEKKCHTCLTQCEIGVLAWWLSFSFWKENNYLVSTMSSLNKPSVVPAGQLQKSYDCRSWGEDATIDRSSRPEVFYKKDVAGLKFLLTPFLTEHFGSCFFTVENSVIIILLLLHTSLKKNKHQKICSRRKNRIPGFNWGKGCFPIFILQYRKQEVIQEMSIKYTFIIMWGVSNQAKKSH